jgi:hypothetical protein
MKTTAAMQDLPRHSGLCASLFALCALACCAGAAADPPQSYQCSTTLTFGPSHCPGTIPPMQDHSKIEIDLERKLWKSDHLIGPIETQGSIVTLKKWGAGMEGRDATLDRASGEFNYHHESGCLVETQTGSCQPVAAP